MSTDNPRFFLGQDGSSHWYLIPVEHSMEWALFRDIPEDDEKGWDVPEWAQELGGGPYHITFTDPQRRR